MSAPVMLVDALRHCQTRDQVLRAVVAYARCELDFCKDIDAPASMLAPMVTTIERLKNLLEDDMSKNDKSPTPGELLSAQALVWLLTKATDAQAEAEANQRGLSDSARAGLLKLRSMVSVPPRTR